MSESICKGCGKPIEWGKSFESGRIIPLTKVDHIYEGMGAESKSGPLLVTRIDKSFLFRSHFRDCPNANKFSGKNKPAKT